MKNFDMNNKDHIMTLLGEISETEQRWLVEREEFCNLVSEFIKKSTNGKVVQCKLAIDSMNEHVDMILDDGRNIEIFLKERHVKSNNHRQSKLFTVTIIQAFGGEKKDIIRDRFEARVFRGNKTWEARVNNNTPSETMSFDSFPESFEAFHMKTLGHSHPALVAFSILIAIEVV